jgi:DNA repair protein RadC
MDKDELKTLEKYGIIFDTDFIDVSDMVVSNSTKEEADSLDFAKDIKDQLHLYYPNYTPKKAKKSSNSKKKNKNIVTDSSTVNSETVSPLSDIDYGKVIEENTLTTVDNKTEPIEKTILDEKYDFYDDDMLSLNEKFDKSGFDNFTEVEIIRTLLGNTIDRKDVYSVSASLLSTFGSLESILQADISDLVIAGLNQDAAHALTRHREVERYLKLHTPMKCCIKTNDDAGRFCCEHFGYDVVESFYVISLDSLRNVKACTLISKGIEHRTEAYPVSVMRAVLRQRASMVILCHNHPGGNLTPSNEDIITTQNIADLLRKMEIPLVDHIICYKDRYTSLFERCSINF